MLTILDTHNESGRPRSRAQLLTLAAAALERAEQAEHMANDPNRTPGGRSMGARAAETWLAKAAALEAAAAAALH